MTATTEYSVAEAQAMRTTLALSGESFNNDLGLSSLMIGRKAVRFVQSGKDLVLFHI